MSGSLPQWKQFAESHAAKRQHFEIIALHDPSIRDTSELRGQLARLEQRWGGPLPFPVALDASGRTIDAYGVRAFPTVVLIDPEGQIVMSSEGHSPRIEGELERRLQSMR